MEKKKLTDEEIVKALMACSNVEDCCDNSCPLFDVDWCVAIMGKHAIDLIHRLQNGVSQWKSKAEHIEEVYNADREHFIKTTIDQKAEIETLLCKNAELEARCEGILKDYYAECQTCDEQEAEIERLTEEKKSDSMLLYASGLACEQVKAENAELQKQVDELKKRLVDEFEAFKFEAYGKVKHHAVKDTAKEIFARFKNRTHQGVDLGGFFVEITLRMEDLIWIKNRYGVEVE